MNVVILIAVFLALVAGHFFPWHVLRWRALVDERGNLNRVPAYAYGVGCIVLGFWAWAIVNGVDGVAVRALMVIVATAALGTIAPRGVRWLIEKQAEMADAEQRIERTQTDGKNGPSQRG